MPPPCCELEFARQASNEDYAVDGGPRLPRPSLATGGNGAGCNGVEL
jgi:hypothetical protein